MYGFQNQRDSLIESNKELEKKLEQKDIQLQEKEEELFQQIEKVFRLEEDCEKVSICLFMCVSALCTISSAIFYLTVIIRYVAVIFISYKLNIITMKNLQICLEE